MHGLGAGPLKRGVPPAQLAALIPLLQAQVDQSTVILPPAEELQTDIVLRADGRVASMEEHLLVKRVTPGGGVESGAVQAGKNGSRIDPDAKDSRKAQRKCLPAQPVSSQSEPQSAVGQVLSGRKGNHKFSARDEGAAVDRNAPRKQPSGIERVRLASTPFKTAENSEPTRAATTPHLPALCSEKEHLKAIAPQKQVDPASSSRPSHDMTKPNLVTAPRTPTATEPPKLTPTESLTPQQLEAATLRAARQLIAALQFMVSSARLGHPLSVSLMLKAHAILMDGLCSHPGEFRRTGCKAGDGFRYPPPKEVSR